MSDTPSTNSGWPNFEVSVSSEIAPLAQVLVHRPGDELARMTQHDLQRLLFDDILSPGEAVREHDLMTELLRGAGAQVVDIEALLIRALELAPALQRERLLEAICELAGAAELSELLQPWPADKLAQALIGGLDWSDLAEPPMTLARIRRQIDGTSSALPPLPNLMFMRDPCFAVRDSLVVGRMATSARAAEPLLTAFAIAHGGLFAKPRLLFGTDDAKRHPSYRCLEGGDVLVLSPELLLIGCSERSSAQTIERLAHEALFDAFEELERVYVVMMPEQRTVMHLDTILTQVDAQLFLGHAPVIAGTPMHPGDSFSRSREQSLPVVRLERGREPQWVRSTSQQATVLDVLREEFGSETDLVPCGGSNPLHQQREQWTDGANALCLAPGRLFLYARNVHTIATLVDRGFAEIPLHMVLPLEQRAALIKAGMKHDRAVFSFPGSELSRARGGGRCLTMPIRRTARDL